MEQQFVTPSPRVTPWLGTQTPFDENAHYQWVYSENSSESIP